MPQIFVNNIYKLLTHHYLHADLEQSFEINNELNQKY